MADTDVAIVVSDDEDSDINVSNHASEVRAMFDTISQSVAVDEKIRPDLYTVYNDDTQFSSVDDYLNTIKGGAPDELLESYDAVLALTNYSPKTPAYAGGYTGGQVLEIGAAGTDDAFGATMGIISGVGPIITAHEVGHLYGGEHPEANMRGVWDATVMWNPAHGKTCNSDPAYVYGHYPEVGDCNIDDFDDVIQSL